jgi:hypothetical protein
VSFFSLEYVILTAAKQADKTYTNSTVFANPYLIASVSSLIACNFEATKTQKAFKKKTAESQRKCVNPPMKAHT